MSSKTYSSDNFDFVAGRYNEKFTYQATATVKKGDVFKQNGNVVGLVLNDVVIDTDEPEARPVAVLISGVVYSGRINATDDEKKALLSDTGIRFLDYTPASGTTQDAGSTTDTSANKPGQ